MPSALITGTSKGIGLEAALAFARTGYTVHAGMRTPAKSPELAQTAAREKLPIHIHTLDVDSDESVARVFAAVVKDYGPIDVLVNNAGIEVRGSIEEMPLAGFRTAMETNYFGVIRCVKQVLPQMRARRSGVIVSVSSVGGRLTSAPLTAYNASKWALEALSEALAGEMKTFGVRVLLVEPGIIDTAMAQRIGEAPPASLYRQTDRFASMFAASLKNPAPPALVAQKILEVATNGTWTLRHPVGPDAEPLLAWRKSMSDEQWIALNAADDETWYTTLERDFGFSVRPAK
ncbi:MAG TPA: SDR family NAD(P)-dependent oxidoreductase [Candidatus Acidoferrales bacterium]